MIVSSSISIGQWCTKWFMVERLAFKWVQEYISNFGGDPGKVTLYGESAGAISIALHMITNNGNNDGLFRAAFMQSGGPLPLPNITDGQIYYDALVSQVGCSGAKDTLACLREAPFEELQAAIDQSPFFISFQVSVLVC